jgi:photosystem II core protein PsbZ
MITITFLTAVLVLLSLGLIVTVPVALATPGEWENSKETYTQGFKIWVTLVITIAAVDGIFASVTSN